MHGFHSIIKSMLRLKERLFLVLLQSKFHVIEPVTAIRTKVSKTLASFSSVSKTSRFIPIIIEEKLFKIIRNTEIHFRMVENGIVHTTTISARAWYFKDKLN